jgi:hypothetical protein
MRHYGMRLPEVLALTPLICVVLVESYLAEERTRIEVQMRMFGIEIKSDDDDTKKDDAGKKPVSFDSIDKVTSGDLKDRLRAMDGAARQGPIP